MATMRPKSQGSRLIVLEGPDGVGKTTIAARLAENLGKDRQPVVRRSFPGNEPGTLGKLVYDIHHDTKSFGVLSINPLSLQILHVASHVDAIIEDLLPRRNRGETIILDRFWWSTVVYGRESNIDESSLEALIALEKLQWRSFLPNVLVLLDRHAPFGEKPQGWARIREHYLSFAENESHEYPVEVLPNTGSISDTADAALQLIREHSE